MNLWPLKYRESADQGIVNRATNYRESTDQTTSPIYTLRNVISVFVYQKLKYSSIKNLGTPYRKITRNFQDRIELFNTYFIYFTCRESADQGIVNRATNYRESADQGIVNRATNYRESTDQGCFSKPLPQGFSVTYPQAANLYLIYFNPRALRAHERLPSVRKAHFAPNKVRPCSALRLALSGAANAAKKINSYPPLPLVVSPQPKAGLTRPNGLRWKGAAKPQPCSLRSSQLRNYAATAANQLCLNFIFLIRARLGEFLALFLCNAKRYMWLLSSVYGLRPIWANAQPHNLCDLERGVKC